MGLDAIVVYSLEPEPGSGDEEEREYWRRISRAINAALAAAGVSRYHPPTSRAPLPEYSLRVGTYPALHYLRRFAAYVQHGRTPPNEEIDYQEDPILEQCYSDCQEVDIGSEIFETRPPPSWQQNFQHLINHSDYGGVYVPIDFPYPLWVQLSGPSELLSIGSSVRLKREVDLLAGELQLPDGIDPDGPEMDVVDPNGPPWKAYPTAGRVCAVLRELANRSVNNHALLLYC